MNLPSPFPSPWPHRQLESPTNLGGYPLATLPDIGLQGGYLMLDVNDGEEGRENEASLLSTCTFVCLFNDQPPNVDLPHVQDRVE
ncbi:hypothetical protein V6N11_068248 [Hibiscus sabdariffa]